MPDDSKFQTSLSYERLDTGVPQSNGSWIRCVIGFGIPPIALGWLLIAEMLLRGSHSNGFAVLLLLAWSVTYIVAVFISLEGVKNSRYRQAAYLMMLIVTATIVSGLILPRAI